ncbi:MAG: transcription antitermination factor NusB [Alphaproteobacteria bacterium]
MSDKVIENITTNTRVATIQCIYSVIFLGEKLSSKTMRYFKNKSFLSEKDTLENKSAEINSKLFSYLVKGVIRNQETIDNIINKNLKIDIEKNDQLVISIIRAGAFEILFRENTPANVIIAEYTKIANEFYPSNKTALVNAVLDKIAKNKKVAS